MVDTETQYLIDLLDQIDRDTDAIAVHTSREVDETIERLEAGEVDCLVCTYDASHPEGLELLDYIREHPLSVPVVLLPARETTIIDSRNLVANVDSVFLREEAVERDVLGPHLVNVVEQRRASAAAERRSQVTDVMGGVARDVAGVDDPAAIDRAVAERLENASAFDGGWVGTVEDAGVEVRSVTEDDPASVPGVGEDGPDPPLERAARNAVEFEQPQVTNVDDGTYAVIPVVPEDGGERAVGICSTDQHAFQEPEVDLLSELGGTLSRTLDTIARRAALESRVDDLQLVDDMIAQVGVGVVVYGPDGLVERANDAFARLVDADAADLPGTAVWTLLPTLEATTFDDYWGSLEPDETDSERADLAGHPYEFVTTPITADDEPYHATIVVESDEGMDEEFATLLSYEFRHWLGLARDAVEEAREERDPERLELVDELVDRMGDAIQTEVQTAVEPDREPAMEPQPLGEVAGLAWNHVLGEAGSHEVRGSNEVLAHRGLLLRLFEHCFRTLLQYAEEATAVDVGLTAGGFYVEDDGAGVPHEQRAYAGDWRSTPSDAEHGAGILIADRAAERMGWSLAVTANDRGGTRFEVSGARYVDSTE